MCLPGQNLWELLMRGFFYSPSHHSVIGVKALEQWYHDKPEDDDVAVVVFRRWKRRDTVSQWFLRWCWTRSLDLCVSTTRTGWYSTRRPRTRTPCSAYSTGRRQRWRSSKSDIWHIPRTLDTLQMLLKIRHVSSLVLIWFCDNSVRIGVSHWVVSCWVRFLCRFRVAYPISEQKSLSDWWMSCWYLFNKTLVIVNKSPNILSTTATFNFWLFSIFLGLLWFFKPKLKLQF